MKKLDIVFEDKNLLVVNKPCKLLTIGTIKDKEHNLYREVYDYLHKKNQKVFIVNRLDKDTSGLVVFAKSEKIKNELQENWSNVIRKYYAIVNGNILKDGTIESYLKETKTLETYSTNDKSGKYAKTIYKPLINNKKYTLLEIDLVTGRKNQIRVHMKDINHPIVGDKKYGLKENPINRMALHAYYLEFVHPVSHELIKLETKIPKEFEKLVNCNLK